MNERQRERLLSRIEDVSGNLGEEIPEEITAQGTEIDLKEFVFEVKRLDTIPEKEREQVDEMIRTLERERLQRKQRIEREEVSYEEGRELVREIGGIERAINALEGLDSPGIEEEMRRQELESARRLRSMVDVFGGLRGGRSWREP